MRALLAIAAGFVLAVPSLAAAETVSAAFTTPDGGVSTGSYSGIVRITVDGIGQSAGTAFNDAFYVIGPPPYNDPSYYQLAFSTTTLVPFDPAHDAVNFIVGGLPAYDPSHSYTFLLNTGLSTPGQLHFGVSDGDFGDNSGSYRITISAVPEPATWAMMVGGFAFGGFALRRRNAVLGIA